MEFPIGPQSLNEESWGRNGYTYMYSWVPFLFIWKLSQCCLLILISLCKSKNFKKRKKKERKEKEAENSIYIELIAPFLAQPRAASAFQMLDRFLFSLFAGHQSSCIMSCGFLFPDLRTSLTSSLSLGRSNYGRFGTTQPCVWIITKMWVYISLLTEHYLYRVMPEYLFRTEKT